MPSYPDHVIEAALSLRPHWLARLIARHGHPLVVREVDHDARSTEYVWTHERISVLIGETCGRHYVVAASANRSAQLGLDRPPTAAEVSNVVALAGLDDAPEQSVNLSDLYAGLDSARTVMALSSRDWSRTDVDAWLYGILVGWDGDPTGGDVDQDGSALDELAARFRWSEEKVDRLRRLRSAVVGFDINAVADLQRGSERAS